MANSTKQDIEKLFETRKEKMKKFTELLEESKEIIEKLKDMSNKNN
jgi:hypothetical protein